MILYQCVDVSESKNDLKSVTPFKSVSGLIYGVPWEVSKEALYKLNS